MTQLLVSESSSQFNGLTEVRGEVPVHAGAAPQAHQLALLDHETRQVGGDADHHVLLNHGLFKRQMNVLEGPGFGVGVAGGGG